MIELIDDKVSIVCSAIVVGTITALEEFVWDDLDKIGVRQQEVDDVIKLIILSATLATLTPTPHGFTIACLMGSAFISAVLQAVPQC
jgi:hypothetical protein